MEQNRNNSESRQAFTYDEALGFAIEQQRFAEKVNQETLALVLSLSKSTISRKLRGKVPWTAVELSLVADFFSLNESDLTPKRDTKGDWIPANYVPGHAKSPVLNEENRASAVVAGTGFEPATSGL